MWTDILFDLDGTLTDSAEGVTNSVCYALREMGLPIPQPAVLERFIGPPLAESFRQVGGLDAAQTKLAVKHFRVYFSKEGVRQNTVYDGMFPLLEKLKSAGRRLYVATNKAEFFARRVLDMRGLMPYFDLVAGSDLVRTDETKADMVARVLQQSGADPAGAVMVGDRRHDVEGAKANGIACVGVLYGYGSRAELADAGATIFAETVADLGPISLNGPS
ncbi:MAG: HAD family hydrolase [Oscillospiraceae bacterium]